MDADDFVLLFFGRGGIGGGDPSAEFCSHADCRDASPRGIADFTFLIGGRSGIFGFSNGDARFCPPFGPSFDDGWPILRNGADFSLSGLGRVGGPTFADMGNDPNAEFSAAFLRDIFDFVCLTGRGGITGVRNPDARLPSSSRRPCGSPFG